MPKTKITKTIFSLGVILTLAFFVVPLAKEKIIKVARADVTESVTGWLWGGSEDRSISGTNGTIDGNETSVGWTVMNNVDKDGVDKYPGSSFGVNVPETDGPLSGYAWNGNLGWISFEPSDLSGCPGGHGACNARRVGNNIEGWARIMSIKTDLANSNSGGWQGWILLNSVVIDPATGEISGYGWNGENTDDPAISPSNVANGLGWIEFKAEMGVIPPIEDCNLTVAVVGNGRVNATPPDAFCNGNCSWSYDKDTEVNLVATPNTVFWEFKRWDGDCTVDPLNPEKCVATMSGDSCDRSVTATFEQIVCDCGNGNIDNTFPCDEECDDGDAGNGDCPKTCSTSCEINHCEASRSEGWKEVAP